MSTWWKRLDELDQDQKKVISLPTNVSHLLLGPPGSGKTNLLLLRAKHLGMSELPNILILVYTRVLKEFLLNGSAGYGGDSISDALKTYSAWQVEFLRSHSVAPARAAKYIEERQQRNAQIAQVITTKKLRHQYDTILIDEAQDYWPEELENLRMLGKYIFAAGDPNQKIYKGTDVTDTLKSVCGAHTTLKYHYRNCPEICRLADQIANTSTPSERLETSCNYNTENGQGSIRVEKSENIASLAAKIEILAQKQLDAYPGEMIGICAFKRESLLELWQHLEASSIAPYCCLQLNSNDHSYAAFNPEHKICISTISGSKGLEFRALHLLGLEHLTGELQRNLVYTAVTRAKTSLNIHHIDDLPRFIRGTLSPFAEPKPISTIGSLFKS